MKTLAGTVAILAGLAILFVGGTEESKHALQVAFAPDPEATIIFGGDLMFDRSVRTYMRERGRDHVLSCIKDTLLDADLAVANLEGPITTHSSMSEGSVVGSPENFTFTFDPEVAKLLYDHNLRLVNIGNNHIMNFGLDGLRQTKTYLTSAGVSYFGDPESPEAERVARMEVNGIPFSFVNWSDWTSDKTDHTVSQVRTEAELGNMVVVYTHWGEEYIEPQERTKALARQFIDAGAAIVIGSHPHIVQEVEFYNGKYIYYSLGNFLFDQYFSKDVTEGLLIKVTFGEEGARKIEEMPIEIKKDRTVCLL